MKQTSKLKTLFHSVIFAYIYLMIALVIPTNYSVTAPNKSRSTNTMVSIEGKNQTPHLKSVSVLSMSRITGFARMLYEMNPQFEVEPLQYAESVLSPYEYHLRGIIQKEASFEQSLITAYTLAHETNDSITIDYDLVGMIIDFRSPEYNTLKIGDIITDIDDNNFTDYETMGMYFILNEGDFKLDVLRDDKVIEITINKTSDAIFRFYPKYQINQASPQYSLPGMDTNLTGPSAGMMYTLSIYFALIDYDAINVDIVGTGTIRYNNEIGPIGGLVQKIYGAQKEGIKHFLIPAVHYDEVKHLSHLINIYPVATIEEAIEVITNEILN